MRKGDTNMSKFKIVWIYNPMLLKNTVTSLNEFIELDKESNRYGMGLHYYIPEDAILEGL